jgi:hypothetical protein
VAQQEQHDQSAAQQGKHVQATGRRQGVFRHKCLPLPPLCQQAQRRGEAVADSDLQAGQLA